MENTDPLPTKVLIKNIAIFVPGTMINDHCADRGKMSINRTLTGIQTMNYTRSLSFYVNGVI